MRRRPLALAAVICGMAIAVGAQRLAPIAGPPLFDGVVVEDPYRWLAPPAGFSGGAQPAASTIQVARGQNPDIVVATSEQPPQAQVFTGAGSLSLPPGTASIDVSIRAVEPGVLPSDGVIAGNVYRISLANQTGTSVTGQQGGGTTVVLRGPPNLTEASIERLSGGTWTKLQTEPAGTPNIFIAPVTEFGDFAIVAPPGWVPSGNGSAGPVAVGPAAHGSAGATPAAGPGAGVSGEASGGDVAPWLPIALVGLALVMILGGGVAWLVRPRRVPIGRPAPRQPAGQVRPAKRKKVRPRRQ